MSSEVVPAAAAAAADLPGGASDVFTLSDSVRLALPYMHQFLRQVVCLQMRSRWRRVLFQNPRMQMKTFITSSGQRNVEALPYIEALQHVRSWLPWAITRLLSEVNRVATTLGGITDEVVQAGANAPELYEYDDEVEPM